MPSSPPAPISSIRDFFEALGFKHYIATDQYKYGNEDAVLRELKIDRIYDTFIDEDELRICDDTIEEITNSLEPRPYSSREFIREMGAWLQRNGKTPAAGGVDSVIFAAYEKQVPIFVPAFSDCSAGFGLVAHQHARQGKPVVSIDSAKDFYELTKLKIENPSTGLLMVCGGVPKNFAQDIVVSAEILGSEAPMHKYAIQITVADSRDRSALRIHPERSLILGQGRPHLRADGLLRSDARLAADRRLRLPQERLYRAHREEVCRLPGSSSRHRLTPKQTLELQGSSEGCCDSTRLGILKSRGCPFFPVSHRRYGNHRDRPASIFLMSTGLKRMCCIAPITV